MDCRLLILCSLLIYGMVMIFLPQSYTVVASSRVESEIQQLTETLSRADFADSGEILNQFSRENQALVFSLEQEIVGRLVLWSVGTVRTF